jgi:hypothetical protein
LSSGVVMCQGCRREVHQWGPKVDGRPTWVHCDNRSPICAGCHAVYPNDLEQLVGPWCGVDGDGELPRGVTIQPAPARQSSPKVRFTKGSFKRITR